MKLPVNFEDLISEANGLQLYQNLVKQLNKDFNCKYKITLLLLILVKSVR